MRLFLCMLFALLLTFTLVESHSLFKYFPCLQKTLPYKELGDLPTPLHNCSHIHSSYPSLKLFIKQDGLIGPLLPDGRRLFGGNKVRKLRYLLADAIAQGHSSVITYGCAGSNHALQTALYAQSLGVACSCVLKPQPYAPVVRRNLLGHIVAGSQLYSVEDTVQAAEVTNELCSLAQARGEIVPYIIPTGGSVALGAIGYVEAAFELQEQIEAGLLPPPDHIYITLGSGGSAAGLILGCMAAGITVQFHCVLIEPEERDTAYARVYQLLRETNKLLQQLDPSFPNCTDSMQTCEIIDSYTGPAYGVSTQETEVAIAFMKEYEGIVLDSVYTGKCGAALLADIKSGKLNNSTVIFWNTSSAHDMDYATKHIDYHHLPVPFHHYFEDHLEKK